MNKPDPFNEPEPIEAAHPIHFREWFQFLREAWWFVLPVTALAGGLAWYYASTRPLVYTAKVVLQVAQEGQKLISIEDVSPQDLRASEVLNTIVANIKNSAVMRRVVRANALTNEAAFLPGHPGGLTEEQAMGALAAMTTGRLRKETRLIDILVEHSNAAMAQKLANSVAQEFILQNLEQRFSTTQAANDLLYQEAAKLKAKLEASERRLQEYKEQRQTVSLEERQNIVVEKLKDLNRNYTAAQSARLTLEADLSEIQKISNRVDALLALPSVNSHPAIADLRQKVIALEAHVKTLALRYKPKYPKMIQAQRELQDLRDALDKLVLAAPLAVQSAHEGALARENQLAGALRQAQQDALELDKSAIQYHVLLREVESDRALCDSVLRRLKETDLTKGLEKQSIAIVEPAGLPPRPAQPARELLTAGGAFGGFLASLALVVFVRLMSGSIQSVDEAETTLGLPVLAAIPRTRRAGRKALRPVLVKEPDSTAAEAFRSLRTMSLLTGKNDKKTVFLFTSAVPGEGKTFCSLNFAVCLALEGQRTLLVDCDLRRPSVGERLSLPPETPGVREYLLGQTPFIDLPQATPFPNLFVMPAGAPLGPPTEVLSTEATRKLLQEAGRQFDRIVLDSAPINSVSDTLLILPNVHFTFLVVRASRTLRRAVLRALELMARANVPPSGAVLNFLPERSGYGYYYHYAQDYSYRAPKAVRAKGETRALAQP